MTQRIPTTVLMASAIAIAIALAVSLVVPTAPPANAAALAPIRLVSAADDGSPADHSSTHVSLSGDGRYAVFTSHATNLPGAIPTVDQIYRKDLSSGEVELVSATSSGESGSSSSASPSISDDGRYVAFTSSSSNLGALWTQVFLRDVVAGRTYLVSKNLTTDMQGRGVSADPKVSGDGGHVVFTSQARDLIDGATPSTQQVYWASLTAGVPTDLRFASLQDSGRSPTPDLASADAGEPAVSRDGSRVVFSSAAVNLTQDRATGLGQIWMHDMNTGATVLVSRSVVVADSGGDGLSLQPTISADGEKIAFESRATDLQPITSLTPQVYYRDLGTGITTLVSVDARGTAAGNSASEVAVVSADGSAIAFVSYSSNLSSGYTADDAQVFRRDLVTGTTTLWSSRPISNDAPEQGGRRPAISADGRTIAYESAALGLVDEETPDDATEVYARSVAEPAVVRLRGADRFDTAAAVASDAFGANRPVVYIATGGDFADALSASAAAGAGGGPVLLVTKNEIPRDVGAQLDRLHPARIVLVGGSNSVSVAVEEALKGFGPVQRLGGADRFEVSALVSRTAFPDPVSTVYLASGATFPDALGGAAATRGRGPVLLVTKDAVPTKVAAELGRLAPANIVVLGGRNAISDSVVASLPTGATVTRVGGADRYVVSAAVSARSFASRVDTVYVASGVAFPDALSGSAAAVTAHAPVLLVTRHTIPTDVATELTRLKPRRIVVLGGIAAISDDVQSQLAVYLAR